MALLSANTQASGYRFGSQSVSGQNTADANGAEADDASTMFSNPAGLTRLPGRQLLGAASVVLPHSSFTDTGSTRFTGASTGGTAAHDYVPNAVTAPSLYYSQNLDPRWTVGLGMFVPYGVKLDYGDSWTGRYAITSAKLVSLNLNPSAGVKLDEHHALGFGISAEYMKAQLAQGVDVPGAVAALSANPASAAAFAHQVAALGGNPAALAAAKDGRGANEGKDWAVGFNLGYLFTPDAATRFGLAYRSSISHQLKGATVWDFSGVSTDAVVNQLLAVSAHRANSAALVALRTPETVSANVFRQLDARWSAMADLTWTRNARLGDLAIEFPGTTEANEVIRQQWRNTYRLALGTAWRASEALSLRAGIAYDQAPVRSSALTHPALPDGDRRQFSFGAHLAIDAHSALDLAYSFVAVKDVAMAYTNACNPLSASCTGNGETTRGNFQTRVQLLGLGYNYRF